MQATVRVRSKPHSSETLDLKTESRWRRFRGESEASNTIAYPSKKITDVKMFNFVLSFTLQSSEQIARPSERGYSCFTIRSIGLASAEMLAALLRDGRTGTRRKSARRSGSVLRSRRALELKAPFSASLTKKTKWFDESLTPSTRSVRSSTTFRTRTRLYRNRSQRPTVISDIARAIYKKK